MNWTGKILGMVIGFIFGGPVGVVIGLFLGHLVDQGFLRKLLSSAIYSRTNQSRVQGVFFNATFMMMGYVAKSDGRVSENEIRAARHVMNNMGLSDSMKREAIRLFTEGKQPHFNPHDTIAQLKQVCLFQPNLLRMFVEIQIQMAYADGRTISDRKRQVLESMCQQLGVTGFNFNQYEQRYRAEQNYQRYRQAPRQDPKRYINDAYEVLGVASTSTDAEIKKAYRRLMSQHHPDKLMSKGLPPEMIKMATQKTQQIKSAYEQIRKARAI